MRRLFFLCALGAVLVLARGATADDLPLTRQPAVFDLADYLNLYPDMMRAYAGTTQAADYWLQTGLPKEGRRASVIFDPQYYLERNPDLRAKFGSQGYESALRHFLSTGLAEGRRGSLEFDPKFYLGSNPDLAQAYGATNYRAAADHFRVQGLPKEGRAGSAEFAIKAYIGLYPDVAAAYGNTNYRAAMWHWLRRGKAQARVGAGAPKPARECASPGPARGFSRIFIALRSDGRAGAGTASDPYDGSNEDKFDAILRARSEANQHNLIVCIGPGSFRTRGTADFVINVPHKTATGFTLNQNWHVHGAGMDQTTLLLTYFQPQPKNMGVGIVFSTHDDQASGIEISDVAVDNNYPELKRQARGQGIRELDLEAIHLRSDQGGHHVHHLRVRKSAGESVETFPVSIGSVNAAVSSANLIEFVIMSDWGAGKCAGIALFRATGEVRYNVVRDYEKGFGGWSLIRDSDQGHAWFHDNFALENPTVGFIVDSLQNDGVVFEFNEVIHPGRWGIILGAGERFANFQVTDNTIELDNHSAIAFVIQSNVTNSTITRNLLLLDPHAGNAKEVVMKGSGTHDVQIQNKILRATDCGPDGRCAPAMPQ